MINANYQRFLSEIYTVSSTKCQRKIGKNAAISSFLRIKKQMHNKMHLLNKKTM